MRDSIMWMISCLAILLLTTKPHAFTLASSPSTSSTNLLAKQKFMNLRTPLNHEHDKVVSFDSIMTLQSSSETTLEDVRPIRNKIAMFADKNFFLIGLFFAVLSAKFFPFVSF